MDAVLPEIPQRKGVSCNTTAFNIYQTSDGVINETQSKYSHDDVMRITQHEVIRRLPSIRSRNDTADSTNRVKAMIFRALSEYNTLSKDNSITKNQENGDNDTQTHLGADRGNIDNNNADDKANQSDDIDEQIQIYHTSDDNQSPQSVGSLIRTNSLEIKVPFATVAVKGQRKSPFRPTGPKRTDTARLAYILIAINKGMRANPKALATYDLTGVRYIHTIQSS